MSEYRYRLQWSNRRPLMENLWRQSEHWLTECENLEIVVRPYKSKRSNEQNKRLWKIYQTLADYAWVNGKRYSQEVWHEYCKKQFIGQKELPDGSLSAVGISTTALSTSEMTDYQNTIQAWAAQEFGLIWDF